MRTPTGWPEVNREEDTVHSTRAVDIEIFTVVFRRELFQKGSRAFTREATRDSRKEEQSLGGLLAESREQVSSGSSLGPDSSGR